MHRSLLAGQTHVRTLSDPGYSAATVSICRLGRHHDGQTASAKLRAIAAPMPRPLPVTRATFSSSEKALTMPVSRS